jgi:hypothetical protein
MRTAVIVIPVNLWIIGIEPRCKRQFVPTKQLMGKEGEITDA